jgi:hypothetical protein
VTTHVLTDAVLLLLMLALVVGHVWMLRDLGRIVDGLTRIEHREEQGRQEIISRALALEQRTTEMAEKVREEAKARHDRTVEAALQASEAARLAADKATETNVAVHKLTDAKDKKDRAS